MFQLDRRIFSVFILFYLSTVIRKSLVNSKTYNIGVLYNNEALVETIEQTRDYINQNSSLLGLRSSKINVTWYNLSSNPVQATKDICDYLIANQVYVVITTNAINSTKSPDIVSYACAFYKIPTIAIEARETELSDTVRKYVKIFFLKETSFSWFNLLQIFSSRIFFRFLLFSSEIFSESYCISTNWK